MKLSKLFVFLLALFLVVGTKVTFAQDEEMTMDEWQRQIDEYTAKKDMLNGQLNDLNKEIDALKKTSADKDAALVKAEEDLYTAVGSNKAGVADWRSKFEALEKDVKAKKVTKEEAEKRYAELEKSKVRCLTEFWNRWNQLKKDIEALTPPVVKTNNYTVVKGDCLWKISAKKEIYGNPKVWPAIWEANKAGVVSAPPKVAKTIKNPNLIYPGQVLKIPTLTDAQKTEAIAKANKYHYKKWRKKKVEKTEGTEKKEEKKDVKKEEKKDVKKDVKKEEKKVEEKKK